MSKLVGLAVRRFRSLFDMPDPINISPITILVGRNSVGKSTFARIFPLLRQSINRRKRGPFVWFDDRLVDFGGIDKSISWGEDSLEIEYCLDGVVANYVGNKFKFTINKIANVAGDKNPLFVDNLKISSTIKSDGIIAYTSRIKIKFEKHVLEIIVDENSREHISEVILNDKNMPIPIGVRVNVDQGHVIPQIEFVSLKNEDPGGIVRTELNPWRGRLMDSVRTHFHGNTSPVKLRKYASAFPICGKRQLASYLKDRSGDDFVERMVEIIRESNNARDSILPYAILANLAQILDAANSSLSEIAMGVRYIRPLRASAERYYRRADLAVDEIEPDGSNLPVFLDSLSEIDLKAFVDWISQSLGIEVAVSRVDSQLEVKARTSVDQPLTNVADMGFGLSQVLPIAAQLWLSSRYGREGNGITSSRFSRSGFVVIEQPELHLHPAMQASLADLFAKLVDSYQEQKNSWIIDSVIGGRVSLIVETHSQHIINRLGYLVENKILKKEDVSILIFEADENKKNFTKLKSVSFDDDGMMVDWPFGFFEP